MSAIIRLAAMICGLALSHATAADPNMRPGLWETTVRTEMAGMPMQMPPVTHRQCLREEDLVPQVESSDQECRVVDQKTEGNSVSWRIECKSEDMQMDGRGQLTYAGDAYKGRVEIQTSGGQMGDMTMVQKLEGQRLGECP